MLPALKSLQTFCTIFKRLFISSSLLIPHVGACLLSKQFIIFWLALQWKHYISLKFKQHCCSGKLKRQHGAFSSSHTISPIVGVKRRGRGKPKLFYSVDMMMDCFSWVYDRKKSFCTSFGSDVTFLFVWRKGITLRKKKGITCSLRHWRHHLSMIPFPTSFFFVFRSTGEKVNMSSGNLFPSRRDIHQPILCCTVDLGKHYLVSTRMYFNISFV